METRTENWCGYDIRFVRKNGEWYAILKDLCDALKLRTDKVAERLDPEMMERVQVEIVTNYDQHHPSKGVVVKRLRANSGKIAKRCWMLAVNELGVYEALFASRRLEARKLRRWTCTVLSKLRNWVGLEGYQVLQMTDTDVQRKLDIMLDDIFYNDEKKMLMTSVTVPGGDVEQVPANLDLTLGEALGLNNTIGGMPFNA